MKRTFFVIGPAALSLCLLLALMGDRLALGASASTPPAASHGFVLHVVRYQFSVSSTPTLEKDLYDAAAAQRLYAAALALPVAPYVRLPCLQMGVIYHLTFVQDGHIIHIMDIEPNGCGLSTIYPAYTRLVTPTFLRLLATTLELNSLVPTS
jgi:hypothetical protein